MRIDCVLKNGDNCLAVNETIENIEKTRGWGCKTKEYCCWCEPGATGKERDEELLKEYRRVKKLKSDDILYEGQLNGHCAIDDNGISTIWYEACMLALFMNKKWKCLTDIDFCLAFEQAKRLGFRLPTNSKKACRIRKKRSDYRITIRDLSEEVMNI